MKRWLLVVGMGSFASLVGCPTSPPALCDYEACDPPDGAVLDGGDSGFDAPPNCDLKKDPKDSLECIVDSVGIFVSEGGQDTNAGTKASPVKTINKAVAIAGGRPRIYVCAGSYPAALIDKGVSVYGGFDCATWAATGAGTLVEAPLNAMTVKTPVAITVADMTLSAKSGSAAGDSAVAALVTSGSNVTFRRVKFTAGDGKPGAAGSENTTLMAQATKGANAGDAGTGGKNSVCNCPDGTTTGGPGGSEPSQSGGVGEPADAGAGAGGQGGLATCGASGPGGDGKSATAGTAGVGASQLGTIADTGWVGGKGGDGAPGSRGQGGGGGGARTGGGGGAGGCGGCGGEKGGGGGGGGASIGLLVNGAGVRLEACEVAVGNGGAGGKGGAGQKGQVGGDPGGDVFYVKGCNGGAGGNGGDGSTGGGGAGGISAGITYKGTKPVTDAATDGKITVGTKGTKGTGGTATVNDGIDGVAQAVLQVP